MLSLADGFITSLLTVFSFRPIPSLSAPSEIYYLVAVISALILVFISLEASALCFIYVFFMFFHRYFFVDAGFITVGMVSSVDLIGASILKSILINWIETKKKRRSPSYPDMR